MSKVLDTRRLLISSLAPVHMGTDQDYEPTNYVMDGEALYEFDPAGVADAIPEQNRKQLEKLLSGRPDARMLKAVQRLFHENRERLMPAAVNVVRAASGVARQYEARVGQAANVEADGRERINQLQIERCFYNPVTHRPVLPGSGLKGAIRTALLDRVNGGASTRGRESNRDLQQRLFQYSMRDLHKDPLRLVQLGDAAWHRHTDLDGAEIRFAVNRKKKSVEKGGTSVQSQAEQKGLHQVLECVPAFRLRAFEGSLTIPDVSAVDGSPKLPDKDLRFGFADIADACNRFYRPILVAELALLRERGYLDGDWGTALEKLLEGEVAERMQRNEAFLLRVGRHSGAESVTLNGVRSIRIMKGRGERPEYSSQSKTLWLASDQLQEQRDMLPFGWLLVEMLEQGHPDPAWPEAETVTREYSARSAAWWKQVQARRQELRETLQARKEKEAERRREEEARREREEQSARREQERLTAMTPLQREIEEIVESEDNPAVALLQAIESGKWEQEEDASEAAKRVMEIMQSNKEWLPDFSGKNKRKLKLKNRSLKIQGYFKG